MVMRNVSLDISEDGIILERILHGFLSELSMVFHDFIALYVVNQEVL